MILFIAAVNSSNALTIDCDYIFEGINYWCFVVRLENLEPNAEVTGIEGAHQFALSNDNVVGVYIFRTNTHFLPNGFSNFFPNLTDYSANQNAMLKTITNENFEDIPNLTTITLRRNQINAIGRNAFDNLNDLKLLDLGNNVCINKVYETPNDFLQLHYDIANCTEPDLEFTTEVSSTTLSVIDSLNARIIELEEALTKCLNNQ